MKTYIIILAAALLACAAVRWHRWRNEVETSPVLKPWDIVCDDKGNHTFIQENGMPWIHLFQSRDEAISIRDRRKQYADEDMARQAAEVASGESARFKALYEQVTQTKWKTCD